MGQKSGGSNIAAVVLLRNLKFMYVYVACTCLIGIFSAPTQVNFNLAPSHPGHDTPNQPASPKYLFFQSRTEIAKKVRNKEQGPFCFYLSTNQGNSDENKLMATIVSDQALH